MVVDFSLLFPHDRAVCFSFIFYIFIINFNACKDKFDYNENNMIFVCLSRATIACSVAQTCESQFLLP